MYDGDANLSENYELLSRFGLSKEDINQPVEAGLIIEAHSKACLCKSPSIDAENAMPFATT